LSHGKDHSRSFKNLQRHNRRPVPPGSVKRNLVQVFDKNIVSVAGESLLEVSPSVELKRVAGSYTVNVDSVDERARRTTGPAAREQIHTMAQRRDPAEDFMKMYFGTTAVGILSVVPVDDEYPH